MPKLDFDPVLGKPYTGIDLSDLASDFSCDLIGDDAEVLFQGPLSFRTEGHSNVLTYVNSEELLGEFDRKGFDFAIIPQHLASARLPTDRSYLVTQGDPVDVFVGIHLYCVDNGLYYQVESSVGENCRISKRAAIHDHVRIGNNCEIDDYVVIYPNTIIGDDVRILANSVVGSDGFEIKKIGRHNRILPHCGGTVLGDNVEVRASVTIDRSVRHTFTVIGEGSKLSNQVQIGHGAVLGADCIVAGHGQIANVVMGRGVYVGTSACCKPFLTFGDYVYFGMASAVLRSAPSYALLYGNPARHEGWVCRCRARLEFGTDQSAVCSQCGLAYREVGDEIAPLEV